jgi:protoporphyrinogen oxidase
LSTLNGSPEVVCAQALAVVLREGFLGKAKDRSLGYATISLGKLWPMDLPSFLRERGSFVATGQQVVGFRVEGRRIKGLSLEGGIAAGGTGEADAVICAVPVHSFLKICPEEIRGQYKKLDTMFCSPILSVNLWFSQPFFQDPFAILLDTDVQAVFNRRHLWGGHGSEGYVSLVLSAADKHLNKTREEIVDMAVGDLKRCFPSLKKETLFHATVLWEKQATPLPTPAFWRERPSIETPIPNFFLAGDWVDTGLPPTIEASCRSGHRAAALALAC